MTAAEIYTLLNKTYEDLGWADSGANYINDTTLPTIGVTSPNMRSTFIEQLKITLENRFWKALFTPEKNSARNFIVDIGTNGWGVLEMYQQFLTALTPMWEDTNANIASDLVTPVVLEISKKYHDSPISAQFKMTVNRRETAKMFTHEGMTDFINNTLSVLATSAEYWLLTQFINEINLAISNNDAVKYVDNSIATVEDTKKYIALVRGIARDMELPSKLYNADKVLTSLEGSKVFYITDHRVEETMNAQTISDTFNVTLGDISSVEKVYIPAELRPANCLGILLDRRAIIIGMRTYTMRSFMVANALWENYWLSIEGLSSHARFFNFVWFNSTALTPAT